MQTAPPYHPLGDEVTGKGKSLPSLSRDLVVSIHDVSTVTRERVVEMIRDLAAEGVEVTSLLVIPDHHHRGRIDEDPRFGEWLRESLRGGHEAVLHGYFHRRNSKSGEGLMTKAITRSYTAGEGEFYDLSREAAFALLRCGRESLEACGAKPSGFIAPAWLLGKEAEAAVCDNGFEYTTRIGEVLDCTTGCRFPSRSMVYSVRAGWRRGMSLIWNEFLVEALRENPLLRIGLHPPDWDYPEIRAHALSSIKRALRDRQATTYGRWLDQWRRSGHEGTAD